MSLHPPSSRPLIPCSLFAAHLQASTWSHLKAPIPHTCPSSTSLLILPPPPSALEFTPHMRLHSPCCTHAGFYVVPPEGTHPSYVSVINTFPNSSTPEVSTSVYFCTREYSMWTRTSKYSCPELCLPPLVASMPNKYIRQKLGLSSRTGVRLAQQCQQKHHCFLPFSVSKLH